MNSLVNGYVQFSQTIHLIIFTGISHQVGHDYMHILIRPSINCSHVPSDRFSNGETRHEISDRDAEYSGYQANFVQTVPKHQGPVVQSIISLTSSLRGQLVKCFTTY